MKLRYVVGALLIAAVAVLVVRSSGDDSGDDGGAPGAETATTTESTAAAVPEPTVDPEAMKAALEEAVRAADPSGRVEAAALASDWEEPVVVSSGGDGGQPMRMWSMSKVVALVALLRKLGWDDEPGKDPDDEVASAILGAITRSENCRQRRVVLELQQLDGGPEATIADLQSVMKAAGSHADFSDDVEKPDEVCIPYLSGQTEIDEPLGDALLLGVSEWTTENAVRFTNALASDVYGEKLSDIVLGLMKEPKERSREVPPGELTADLDWGAGNVFGRGAVAYKAGWGGAQQSDFLAGQIVVVPLGGGETMSLAVMDHPAEQPIRDDPGITGSPAAIEKVLAAAKHEIGRATAKEEPSTGDEPSTGSD